MAWGQTRIPAEVRERSPARRPARLASLRREEPSPPRHSLESSVSGPLSQALRWDRGRGPRHRRGDSEAVLLGGQRGARPGLDGLWEPWFDRKWGFGLASCFCSFSSVVKAITCGAIQCHRQLPQRPPTPFCLICSGLRQDFSSPPETGASSVQFSRSVVSDSSRPHGLQHARPPCPPPIPGEYPDHRNESTKSQPLAHQGPGVSDKA